MEKQDLMNIFKEASYYSWDLYLFKMNKKNGGSFMFDKANSSSYLSLEVADICNNYFDKLMGKISDIIPYQMGIDFKGFMVEVSLDDDLIKENGNSFIEGIANAQANLATSYHGYVLAGRNNMTNKDLYLVTKCNPFVNLKGLLINPLIDIEEPQLVKLLKRIDCIIYDGKLYADSLRFEKMFGLDSTSRAICEANRNFVIESKVFNEQSNAILLNNRLLKSFQSLDKNNIDSLKERKEDIEVLRKYTEFTYTADGSINLDTTQSVKMMLKYLSNKIAFKDGQAFEASTLKPLALLDEENVN